MTMSRALFGEMSLIFFFIILNKVVRVDWLGNLANYKEDYTASLFHILCTVTVRIFCSRFDASLGHWPFAHLHLKSSINPILIRVYHVNGFGRINSTLTAISPTPTLQLARFMASSFSKSTLLHLPLLLWSSSLPLALHFKFQRFSQNVPIIPPQHMPAPSHSICLCHLNHCFLYTCGEVVGGSGKGLYRVIGWNSGPFLDEKVRH